MGRPSSRAAAAALLVLIAAAPAHAADLAELRAAVASAAEQTRLVFGRIGDLVRGQRGQGAPSSVTARRLQVEVDDRTVPLRAFDGFVPAGLKDHGKEAVGVFVTGQASVASQDRAGRGVLGIETRGLAVGSDLDLGRGVSVGASVGYASTASGDGAVEAGTVALYGVRTAGALALEAVAGLGATRLAGPETSRGTVAFGGVGAGWDLKPARRLGIQPWVRLDASGADTGTRAGRGGTGIRRVSAATGLGASYELPLSWGDLRPSASIGVRQVTLHGAGAEGAQGDLPAEGTTATLRLGVVATPRRGPTLALDGASEGIAGPVRQHRVLAKVKGRF